MMLARSGEKTPPCLAASFFKKMLGLVRKLLLGGMPSLAWACFIKKFTPIYMPTQARACHPGLSKFEFSDKDYTQQSI